MDIVETPVTTKPVAESRKRKRSHIVNDEAKNAVRKTLFNDNEEEERELPNLTIDER